MSYRGPKEVHYLFIDGGCLRQVLQDASEKWFGGNEIEIDYQHLARPFTKAFYYDCLPPQKTDETDEEYEKRTRPMVEHFNRLRMLRGYHVYEGITRRRRKTLQQKKVDVMISVDMLTYSFRKTMHQATLLTSDLDYKPLLDALVAEGMFVNLWYPRGYTNSELIYAADANQPLDINVIYHQFSSGQFRRRFSIPHSFSQQGKNVDGYAFEDSWETSTGVQVEVYKGLGVFRLVFPDDNNLGYFIHSEFSDLELLKEYVEGVHLR